MDESGDQITALSQKTFKELQSKYAMLFGNRPTPNNGNILRREIAHRMQESTLGGISGDLKKRIDELIQSYNPIQRRSSNNDKTTSNGRDARLPLPGSFITKKYKDKRIEVKVLENGFEYQGTLYKNLSAIAESITGSHWNGFMFFGLKSKKN